MAVEDAELNTAGYPAERIAVSMGTSIGSQRLLRTRYTTTNRVRVRITQASVCPVLAEVAVYAEPVAIIDIPVNAR